LGVSFLTHKAHTGRSTPPCIKLPPIRFRFQLAEVAVPRTLFALILCRIERLRLRLLTPASP